jgi:type II restriction enzyme
VRRAEAKEVLAAMGMPIAQQNDNAIYSLLAFAALGPKTPWSAAQAPRLTPHEVIQFARERYRKRYAENTRETIRRQAIHQFVQGGILTRNPDDPGLATNSPRTHYALTDEALCVLRAYGSSRFAPEVAEFLAAVGGGLAARYAMKRGALGVEVVLGEGETIRLSPGEHNRLHARVMDSFRPRFAPGGRALYVGDTDHKSLHVDGITLAALGVPVTKHDKLPDIVLYDEARGWLFLIEAVSSHGPVSAKRHAELEEALHACQAGRVYVSAFPTFREFKKHAAQIAWDTEVWIAEVPEHLLHYNGDRFFGPR